jgi:hypothetical protein
MLKTRRALMVAPYAACGRETTKPFVDVLAGKTRHFMEEDQTSDEEGTFTARHFFALKSGVRKKYEII